MLTLSGDADSHGAADHLRATNMSGSHSITTLTEASLEEFVVSVVPQPVIRMVPFPPLSVSSRVSDPAIPAEPSTSEKLDGSVHLDIPAEIPPYNSDNAVSCRSEVS